MNSCISKPLPPLSSTNARTHARAHQHTHTHTHTHTHHTHTHTLTHLSVTQRPSGLLTTRPFVLDSEVLYCFQRKRDRDINREQRREIGIGREERE